jgi:hypothetical protein
MSRMMARFCGSVRANAEKAPCTSEEMRAGSNGQRTLARKRREKVSKTKLI